MSNVRPRVLLTAYSLSLPSGDAATRYELAFISEQVMGAIPTAEAEQVARIAHRRALAVASLAKTQSVASPFIVLVRVLCAGSTLAFLAISTSLEGGLLGAIAGGALALASIAYGDLRRLQRRVEAVEILAPDGGV